MDGVTILNTFTKEMEISSSWGYENWWSICSIILGLALVSFILYISVREDLSAVPFTITGILAIIMIINSWHSTETAPITHYQVLIDDSVSYTEFISKYQLVDQDGQIYTIRDRDWKEKALNGNY